MRRTRPSDPKWSDVTPKQVFMNRRQLIAGAGALAGGAAFGSIASPALAGLGAVSSKYSTNATPNAKEDITSYCNFYEFGTAKEDPAKHAHTLTTDPWSIEIGGLVDKPGTYDLDDLTKGVTLEERIYRFRCVEAWSMVVPWVGFELKTLLDRVGVQSGAKYVAFETVHRPSEMRGQRFPILDWPYIEGLRLDEAMNPLTIMATGLYDEPMPNQNGAPIRLVVPWKYGFKSIKSIAKITLTDFEPKTSWSLANGAEYGFYSNVNPEVDHPRWSQATERVLGSGLFPKRVPTQMFNGYTDEVAHLYKGMDLSKKY